MSGRALAWGGGAAAVLTMAGLAAYIAVVGLGKANGLAGVVGVFVGLAGVGVAAYGVVQAHRDAVAQATATRTNLAPDEPKAADDTPEGVYGRIAGRAHDRGTGTAVRGFPHLLGVIPAEANCFQHRSLMDAVDAAVADGGTAVLNQVLTGMGGVGKTQLAARYARIAWEAAEVDLLVWVSAASREAIVAVYARAGAQLAGADASDPQAAAQHFLAFLQASPQTWLVVLDDVADPADLRGLWPPHRPSGRVLVTTRRRDAALTGHGRRLIEVGLFTPAEAAAYLTANLAIHGRSDDREEIASLASDLGMLPLALAQAAAFMVDADMDCARYRHELADSRHQLADLVPDDSGLPDDHHLTVAAAWTVSVGYADQLRPVGLARPMLELASMLDPNGIPAGVLDCDPALAYLAASRGSDGRSADASSLGVVEVNAEDAVGALRSLRRLSLLELATDTPARAVAVHSLIQRATREQMSPDRCQLAARALADSLVKFWPVVERDPAVGQALRANAARLANLSGTALWEPEAHAVLARVGNSFAEAGMIDTAIAYFQELKATAEDYLGSNHHDTLRTRHSLAHWRGEAGDAAGAVAALKELLADQIRVLGSDHLDTLNTRAALASWQGEGGNPAGAAAALEELLPDYVRVLGADDQETLIVRNNIADMRAKAGDLAGAVTAFEELLADQTGKLGADHRDTLRTRNSLATWRGQAGDPAGAAAALEVLLADYLRVMGPDHPETLVTRNNMAWLRGRAGDPAGAAAAFEELLADRERILGPDHPYTLATRQNIADCRAAAGDPVEAISALEELLTDYVRVLGNDHPSTLSVRHDLATSRGQAGDPPGAAAAFEELLTDCLRLLGPDHPFILRVRVGLATMRAGAGDLTGSLGELDELLADCMRQLGPDHDDTLTVRHFRADCQGEAGDPSGATAALEKLLADCRRLLGPEHPDTLEIRECLSAWQQRQANEAARRTDIVRIEIGSELLPLADEQQGGQLVAEVRRIRGELATLEGGWVLPPVRIVDTEDIGGREYRILLRGEIVMLSHAPTDWAVLISAQDATAAPANVTEEPGFLPRRVRWLAGKITTGAPETTVLPPSAIIAGNLKHLAREHRSSLEDPRPRQSLDAQPGSHDP